MTFLKLDACPNYTVNISTPEMSPYILSTHSFQIITPPIVGGHMPVVEQTLHSSTVPFINFPLIPRSSNFSRACVRFPPSVNKQTKPRSDEW